MLKYVDFNGEQTPILFGNAAFYQYEKRHKESGFKAFMNAIPAQGENGEIDAMNVKISFFVDITLCAFLAAGNIARKPFTGNSDEVAMWMDNENLTQIMEMITDSLPRAKEGEDPATNDAGE